MREDSMNTALYFVLVACAAYLIGYSMSSVDPLPAITQRLGKTDGAICFATADASGAHWLVRPDGICYSEDNPNLRVDEAQLRHLLETTGRLPPK